MVGIENNSPKRRTDAELNGRLEITRQVDGREESQMVGSKITRQTDGRVQS